jgi:hypothetical protein
MTKPIDPIDPTAASRVPSWEGALTAGRLKHEQRVTLQTMVDEGKATESDRSASILDLEENDSPSSRTHVVDRKTESSPRF